MAAVASLASAAAPAPAASASPVALSGFNAEAARKCTEGVRAEAMRAADDSGEWKLRVGQPPAPATARYLARGAPPCVTEEAEVTAAADLCAAFSFSIRAALRRQRLDSCALSRRSTLVHSLLSASRVFVQ